VELVTGAVGRSWYKVQELYQSYYMRATHLRLIPDETLTPLSTTIDPQDKWIEVDLRQQILIAWERNTPVFAHRVSTGLPGYGTPTGTHYVFDKRITERMVGGLASSGEFGDYYNLPGVPFVCYFTTEWVATHGTYWHNDFGQPHSHGCVNLPDNAAKWIWRWTTPYVTGPALNQFYVRSQQRLEGTRVEVHG
jgi:lipoprotein-anchoring transpeptidase ErfK/SrfK